MNLHQFLHMMQLGNAKPQIYLRPQPKQKKNILNFHNKLMKKALRGKLKNAKGEAMFSHGPRPAPITKRMKELGQS